MAHITNDGAPVWTAAPVTIPTTGIPVLSTNLGAWPTPSLFTNSVTPYWPTESLQPFAEGGTAISAVPPQPLLNTAAPSISTIPAVWSTSSSFKTSATPYSPSASIQNTIKGSTISHHLEPSTIGPRSHTHHLSKHDSDIRSTAVVGLSAGLSFFMFLALLIFMMWWTRLQLRSLRTDLEAASGEEGRA